MISFAPARSSAVHSINGPAATPALPIKPRIPWGAAKPRRAEPQEPVPPAPAGKGKPPSRAGDERPTGRITVHPAGYGFVVLPDSADVFVPACNSCHLMNSTDGSGSYGVYATEASAFAQVGKTSLYAGTEKMLKVVEAGNLGNSALYLKVLGRAKSPSMKNVGGQMPLGAAALGATQKQLLKDWICSGAKM